MIVGIGHKARHGKNTVAEVLCEEAYRRGRPAVVIGFADALKVYCRVDRGMTTKDPVLLQTVGMEKRLLNQDFWVRVLMWTIADLDPATLVLVPDVRFENEALRIRAEGGLLVDVRRFTETGHPYVSPDRPATHRSEVELDTWTDWDRIMVCESGDLGGLRSLARGFYPLTELGRAL